MGYIPIYKNINLNILGIYDNDKDIDSDQGKTHQNLMKMIKEKTAVVGIIGLGYVGLPLAIHFGKNGFKVIGFDLDARKIDKILHGESYIRHIPKESIKELLDKKQFDVTIDFDHLKKADAILICVPTPLNDKMEPDLSYLLSTTETISRHLRPGHLIVLESTT